MEITKTINEVKVGELILMPDIVLNLSHMQFKRGFVLAIPLGEETVQEPYSGSVDIEDILAELTTEEKAAITKFFKIGTAIAANDAIDPDTPITIEDLEDEI